MSRSRKKAIGYADRNPWSKNYANRRLRRKPIDYEIYSGNAYRKEYCSYNICDFRFLYFEPITILKQTMSKRELHKAQAK